MAAQKEADVVATELERVSKKLNKFFETDMMFYGKVKKAGDTEVISNRDMRVPIQLTPGGNFGYFNPDGGDMQRGSGPTYDKATIGALAMRHAIEYTTLVDLGY